MDPEAKQVPREAGWQALLHQYNTLPDPERDRHLDPQQLLE